MRISDWSSDVCSSDLVLPAWDVACGLTAAFGLVSATVERARTGQGRSISLALSDIAFATIGHLGMIAEAGVDGVDRPPAGNDLYGAFGRDFATSATGRASWRERGCQYV